MAVDLFLCLVPYRDGSRQVGLGLCSASCQDLVAMHVRQTSWTTSISERYCDHALHVALLSHYHCLQTLEQQDHLQQLKGRVHGIYPALRLLIKPIMVNLLRFVASLDEAHPFAKF